MTLGLKIVCGLFGALLASLGVQWWFTFSDMLVQWQVQITSVVGRNNLLADMGALFFGSAICVVLGLRAGKSHWLLAAALFMALAAVGRCIGYATDGFTPATTVPFVVEIVSATVFVFTHRHLSKA